MTISSATSSNTYIGNDATYTFSFTFPITSKSHLVVTHIASDGTETVLVENTNYTVTWTGAGNAGSITRIRYVGITPENYPLATGESIRLERTVPIVQTTDIKNAATLRTNTIENIADYLVSIDQQQERKIGAALRIPASETATEALTILPGDRANTWLGFDNDKNPVALTGGPEVLEPGVYHVDQFGAVGDGVTDDTAAVQAAIAAATSGSTVKFSGNKHYYLTSLGTITKPLTIDGCGCRITCDITPSGVTGTPLFSFSGSLGTAYPIGATTRGSNSVTCSTASHAGNFAAGDWAVIDADDMFNKWDGTAGLVSVKEIVRIVSADSGTGVIVLEAGIDNSLSSNVTIQKATMVHGPRVINFGQITEVYAGSPYYVPSENFQGPSAPDIVDFYLCTYPLAERIFCDGWNLQLTSFMLCFGGVARDVRGENPYNPLTGGTCNVFRTFWSRNLLADHCSGLNMRHLIDWNGCVDSGSQNCHAAYDQTVANNAAYETHGWLSRRITSINDACNGGTAWAVGNNVYTADYDITISGFRYYSRTGAAENNIFYVWCGVENVTIRDSLIDTGSGGFRIQGGAKNTKLINCVIDNSRASGNPTTVQIYDGFSSAVWPEDIVMSGCKVIAPSGAVGVSCECQGRVILEDNDVTAGFPMASCASIAPQDLYVKGNTLRIPGTTSSGLNVGYSADIVPTGEYHIIGNVVRGVATDFAFRLRIKDGFTVRDNSAPDNAIPISFVTGASGASADVFAMALAGSEIRNNGSGKDIVSSPLWMLVNGPAGSDRGYKIYTGSVAIWHCGTDSTAEGGANAGGVYRITAYDDAGTLVDHVLYANRTGSVAMEMATYRFGKSSRTAEQKVGIRTAAGQNRILSFESGTLGRWEIKVDSSSESGSDAGSKFVILARNDAGGFIDNAVEIERVSGGLMTINRPLTTNSRRSYAVTSVTSSAGTTVITSSMHTVVVTGSTTHTLTLPAASAGRNLWIKNRSTGTVTVNRAGSDTIDGGTTFNLTAGQGTILVANSTDWCRMANA